MLVAVVDRTTKKRFAAGQLSLICEGLSNSLALHAAPAFGMPAWKMAYFPSGILPKGVTLVMWMMDNADQPGAAGYHDENGNKIPESKIFVETCLSAGYSVNGGPNSVSVVMDHEFKEMWFDPTANGWYPMGGGSQVAAEVCDPVEEQAEAVMVRGQKIWCSDFVYPAYFNPNAAVGPYNWLGGVTKPFQILPGGYLIEMDANGNVTQKFGSHFPEFKKSWKNHPDSHFNKRKNASHGSSAAQQSVASEPKLPAPPALPTGVAPPAASSSRELEETKQDQGEDQGEDA